MNVGKTKKKRSKYVKVIVEKILLKPAVYQKYYLYFTHISNIYKT